MERKKKKDKTGCCCTIIQFRQCDSNIYSQCLYILTTNKEKSACMTITLKECCENRKVQEDSITPAKCPCI